MDIQAAKAFVRSYYQALGNATPSTVGDIISAHTSPDYFWRGMHPFHEQHGAAAVAQIFWRPFLTAFNKVQRRQDVFMAGLNEIDDYKTTWVCSMGHLMGLFDGPWLGFGASRKIAMLRYAEFNKVEDNLITETAMYFDIIHLMQQIGLNPLPPQTGASLVQPGPITNDGLLFGPSRVEEGEATLALINRMRADINVSTTFKSRQEELSRTWHDDMLWWGPGGIGATYTIDRYADQHANPFRDGLSDRRFNGHQCRFAEGKFGGFFGWPSLTITPTGGFLGLPASRTPADMRVVDIYRRDGDKLAENWIFIDILHFLNMQGLDVLGRLEAIAPATGR